MNNPNNPNNPNNLNSYQQSVQKLVEQIAVAERLVQLDQSNPKYSMNKEFLEKVHKCYKTLLTFQGLGVSGALANKYTYYVRYLGETLFIAGRISSY